MAPMYSTESESRGMILPSLIDLRAQSQPHRLFYAFLRSANVDDGLVTISYGDAANAVNKCAWWLQEQLSKGDGLDIETIGYLGPPDFRHAMVALAAAKLNHKVSIILFLTDVLLMWMETLLLSPRNSTAGLLKLLDSCNCRILLTAKDFDALSPVVTALASKRKLQVHSVEDVQHWIDQPEVPKYAFQASLPANAARPFVILHSSGSTGMKCYSRYLLAYR